MITISTTQESVFIPDLNLYVTKLNPVKISLSQYKSSSHILKLEGMGLISCTENKRVVNMSKDPPKRAPIRTAKFSRPNKGGLVKPVSSQVKASPSNPHNTQEMIQKASEEAAKKAVQEVEQKILSNLSGAGNIEAVVQNAIINALGNLQLGNITVQNDTTPVVSGPEEPIYIPSNIVDNNIEGNVNVKSESSNSEGLEDAASQLRAMRKSKNKKEK